MGEKRTNHPRNSAGVRGSARRRRRSVAPATIPRFWEGGTPCARRGRQLQHGRVRNAAGPDYLYRVRAGAFSRVLPQAPVLT